MQPTTAGIFGVSWPWKVYPTWVRDGDLVRQAIEKIIFTPKRSRKNNLVFGSDALELVFESKGPMLEVLVNREIGLALAEQLGFANVLNIDIEQPDSDDEPVKITVHYELNSVPGEAYLEVPKR